MSIESSSPGRDDQGNFNKKDNYKRSENEGSNDGRHHSDNPSEKDHYDRNEDVGNYDKDYMPGYIEDQEENQSPATDEPVDENNKH